MSIRTLQTFLGIVPRDRAPPPRCFCSGEAQSAQHHAENDCDSCPWVNECHPDLERPRDV